MTEKRRHELCVAIFEGLMGLAKDKAADYATEGDTLLNFKKGARLCGMSPYQYWQVLFSKHCQSIMLAIQKDPIEPSTGCEPIEGRIDDAINYLFLLRCLMEDPEVKEIAELNCPRQTEPCDRNR